MKETSIYVEYDQGNLYYHSNFVTKASDDFGLSIKYPTKITGNPRENPAFADLQTMFLNIVFAERPDQNTTEIAHRILKDDVQLLLDVSMFDKNGIPRIDLKDVQNIRIVDGHLKQSLSVSPELMSTAKPPPSLISKITGCCLYGRPPNWSLKFSEELSKQSFDAKKVKFTSLFIDTATEKEIKNSKKLKSAQVKEKTNQLKSEADLVKIFDAAKGNTLVLIGHVEGSDYVIRTSSNVEQLRVSITKIRKLAKERDIQLIDIGCETTKAIMDESFGLGVLTKYNSVEAVKSLERSLEKSTTFEEFLVNVSSEGLKIVLEPSFLTNDAKTASIYSKIREKSKEIWTKVAQITFSNFSKGK
ncbi:MAG: hypothetical protein DU480_03590 [Nitrosomonas sp.]